jgi:Peptidase C1-like family
MNRWMIRTALAILGLPLAALTASAQYPNPYNPYSNPYGGPGGTLAGSAQVMQAYGQVINDQEQARITREKANQAKLDTKKQAFDLMMYEKANTPTYTETLTKEKAQILTRMMNFPLRSEIADGKSLNAMLPFLQSLSSGGTQGPPVPIPQSMVNQLNISGSGQSSVGMLRDGGQVDWPVALVGKNQMALDKLLPQAYSAAADGKLTPKLMRDVRTEMKTMRETMRTQLQKEEIETSSYMQCIEFYNSLESSVNALEKPDARKQLGGAYSPRARNVQELVDFMTDNGVKFAPAAPGNENAYQVVHDAFVRYARTAQSSAGFTASNGKR